MNKFRFNPSAIGWLCVGLLLAGILEKHAVGSGVQLACETLVPKKENSALELTLLALLGLPILGILYLREKAPIFLIFSASAVLVILFFVLNSAQASVFANLDPRTVTVEKIWGSSDTDEGEGNNDSVTKSGDQPDFPSL